MAWPRSLRDLSLKNTSNITIDSCVLLALAMMQAGGCQKTTDDDFRALFWAEKNISES